jgi:hypothetical protein
LKPLQLTLDRTLKVGVGDTEVARLALTMTLQGDRALMDVDPDAVRVALAQALSVLQWAILPSSSPVASGAADSHPKDSILCQRGDGSLVRVAGLHTFDDLATRGLKYLTDAYDARGGLLPAFWLLPLIDPANQPRCGNPAPHGLYSCQKDQGHKGPGHSNGRVIW